ncbi:MAG: NAD-dependent epimerase/dehydratase family protein [Acidimicrobiales bacterium]
MTEARLQVVLVGGTGFLGRGLRERLTGAGHAVTVIGRGLTHDHDRWTHVQWDAANLGDWVRALDGADAVVHLVGKRVDCRPTRSNIDELIASRVDSVHLVGEAIAGLDRPPTTWVQLSSLAIFGDGGDAVIDESTEVPTTGPRQQVEVCRRWEAAFAEASVGVERTVLLRPGIAIGGADDPASRQLALLARFGLGGKVGSGDQWVSWVGAEDLFDVLLRAVIDPTMHGVYHVTSPNPVRNRELMAAYRRAVGRSFGLPSPSLVATIGAWLLGSDPGLALTGRRCVPTRLLAEGQQFAVTDLDEAVSRAVRAAR